jgi:lipid-A-disaccharide synthase
MSTADAGAPAPLVFLVAGEASGDLIGQRLMRALRHRLGPVRFAGIGGARMAEEGLESLFPLSDLSLVGIGEVLPHIPKLLRRIRETAAEVERMAPVLVLFIDASGFARGVARRLKKRHWRGLVIQYKAPQTWAYWPWRARAMARDFDLVLCILPFEPEHLARYGGTSAYIGHPALESGAGRGDGAAFRARHALPPDQPLLVLLPGSRSSEIRRSLPLFGAVARRLAAAVPGLRIVVPTVETVAERVRTGARDWPGQPIVVGGAERFDAMAAASAALCVTGTVTVELALARLPMVACYKVSFLTSLFFVAFVRVRWAAMVNLLLGREAVPEFLQHRATPAALAGAVRRLLTDPAARQAQQADLDRVRALLQPPGGVAPTEAAADMVVRRLRGRAAADSPS